MAKPDDQALKVENDKRVDGDYDDIDPAVVVCPRSHRQHLVDDEQIRICFDESLGHCGRSGR